MSSTKIKEGDLNRESNMQRMHIAGSDEAGAFYDLNVIILAGYRFEFQHSIQIQGFGGPFVQLLRTASAFDPSNTEIHTLKAS